MQPASGWCGPAPGQLGAGFFVPKTPHEKKIRFRKKKCLHGQRAGYGDPVAASNANQPTTEMQTTTILFRNEAGTWTLARYKGGIVPSSEHATAKAARDYAKTKNWQVRRASNCDA